MTLILGLETSCDETAAAVVEDGHAVRSNVIASQHDLHAQYGGVVPEIASRAHLERISPVLDKALTRAGVTLAQIDAVAVGNRPGLVGSLIVGVSAAKALAWALGKPIIGVDHVRAHLYAAVMGGGKDAKPQAVFPALGLVVSGGHTSLYRVDSPLEMTLLGSTIDDAVGEAYDKAAVILGLPFPGGPMLDKLAQTGNPTKHRFPRSLLEKDSLDFSYSGLKTAMLYAVRGHPVGRGDSARFERTADDLSDDEKRDLAAAFQDAAIDTLMVKLQRALDRDFRVAVLIGGGVSANSLLRRRAMELGATRGIDVRLPAMSLCLDNAAMIAGLAWEHYRLGRFDDLELPVIATTGR